MGSNPFPDTAYWNTATAANYADNGAGGVGIFRRDTNWTPFSGAVTFEAQDAIEAPTLSPLALLVLAFALALMTMMRLRSVGHPARPLPPRPERKGRSDQL